jgi:hypothetical protein
MTDSIEQVMDLIFGRWRSQTRYVGAELGVFDHLDRTIAKEAASLAEEMKVDAALLYRLLRAIAAIGLVAEGSSREFTLTAQGELLRSDHPRSLRPMARLAERTALCFVEASARSMARRSPSVEFSQR